MSVLKSWSMETMGKLSFDNRVFPTLHGLVGILAVILIGACSSSPPQTGRPGQPELVEGGVIFRYFDTEATSVHVVGDFNNWSLRADPMVDKNGDGEWTLFYTLVPGVYEYKFVVNGTTWIHDPRNPHTAPDGFEGINSVVRIRQKTNK